MTDEAGESLSAVPRLLEWADGMYDGSGCVYCQFSEGHDADCLVDAAIAEAAAAPALDAELITEYVAITISRQKNGLGISYTEARAIGAEVAARLLSESAPLVAPLGETGLTWTYSGQCPKCGFVIDAELPALPSEKECDHDWMQEGTIGERWYYCSRCKVRVAEKPK